MAEAETLRFGVFELDRRTGELRRSGRRLHLTPQSVQLLLLLAERSGTLVTREDIRDALWPKGTFVEFDAAVNACVSQIRAALGDKASSPRFVETLPRRGYRFIAPVESIPNLQLPTPTLPEYSPAGDTSQQRVRKLEVGSWKLRSTGLAIGSTAAAIVVLVVIAAVDARRSTTPSYVKGRSVEALQKYERARGGLEDASPTELTDRVRFFTTAIDLSPDFAEAYAGLADAKLILAAYRVEAPQIAYPAAKAAAAKALALDPDLPDAHAAYATAVLLLDWNWVEARAHFARALSNAPGSPRVHHWYARYLTAIGRHDEARAHAQRAVVSAPTSPSAATYLGVAQFYAGDMSAARRSCQRALDLMPEFTPARRCLDALDGPQTSSAAMPDMYLASAIRAAHDGDVTAALDQLQRAANRHSDALVYASVLPGLKTLHGNHRFNMVLERVGLRAPEYLAR